MPDQPEVLLLVASNIDLPSVKDELRHIVYNSLHVAGTKQFIDPQTHLAPDYDSMQQALTNAVYASRITMLHYSGHSFEKGIVVEEEGKKHIVGLAALKNLIQAHQLFRFVFLNSCYSEEIAKAFIDCGVPLVIGTTSAIKDNDAATVATKFYEILGAEAKSIPEAYALTHDYFANSPQQLSVQGVFRSLDTGQPDKTTNVWKLYMAPDIEALLENEKKGIPPDEAGARRLQQTAKWTLVPRYRTLLSESQDYQLKVLCLYTKAGEIYYKAFKNKFAVPNKKLVLLHGVSDIFGARDFDRQIFEKELAAADAVLHFIEGNAYLNSPFFQSAQKLDACSKHAYVPINSIDKDYFEQQTGWFAKSMLLKTKMEMFGDYISELYGSARGITTESKIESAFGSFRDSWELFAGTIDGDELAQHMKEMPFTTENYNASTVNNAPARQLYLILLEGTDFCAQQLLIKKIRLMKGIDPNIKSIRISFSALKIYTAATLWEAFAKSIDDEYLVGDEADIPGDCATLLIKKLKNNHVVLVFELFTDIHADIYMQEIEGRFWQEFTALFAKYSKNNQFFNNFICFAVNYNIEKKPLQITEKYNEIRYVKISPVTRLTETEWNVWYVTDPIYKKLLVYHQLCQPDVFRKKALIEICRSLKVPLNYVDNKVLIYD